MTIQTVAHPGRLTILSIVGELRQAEHIVGELRQAEHIENWVDLLRRDGRASTPNSDVRKIHVVGRVTAPTSPPA